MPALLMTIIGDLSMRFANAISGDDLHETLRARLELFRIIEASCREKAADSAALLARLDESAFVSIKGE